MDDRSNTSRLKITQTTDSTYRDHSLRSQEIKKSHVSEQTTLRDSDFSMVANKGENTDSQAHTGVGLTQ